MAEKKQKKPKGKVLKKHPQKLTGGLREWLSLPITLKNKKNQAQMEMVQIQNAFIQ